jgi:predicted transcriptional regulator
MLYKKSPFLGDIRIDQKAMISFILTGRQIAAARTMLGLRQSILARSASISVPTLKRMEASEGRASGMANNVAAVRRALEDAGVEFICEGGTAVGVRLRMNE